MLKKVLVILSSAQKMELQEGTYHPTGYHLTELTDVLKKILASGYRIDVATPNGETPIIDPLSKRHLTHNQRLEAYAIIDSITTMNLPFKLEELREEILMVYSGLFIPGGHAPLVDLAHNTQLKRILKHFHNHHKPTATLCHGPAALLSATDDEHWIYEHYRMTCFPKYAEKNMEENILSGHIMYYLDDELVQQGAELEDSSPPGIPHIVVDRELITGQDPFSSKQLGTYFLKALDSYLAPEKQHQ